MRKMLVAALLITLLVVLGWMSFRYDGRNASVNLDTQEIRSDTQVLVEKGQSAVNAATERGKELIRSSEQPAEKR